MFRDLIGKGVEICNIGLQQGYIKEDGSVSTSGDTDHSKWVTTGFIEGGVDFLIHLNEGYFVNKVSIYDKNKKLLCVSYLASRGAAFHQCTEYSYHMHKNYMFRLGIVHDGSVEATWVGSSDPLTPDQDITPTDDIIKDFFRVDLNYFTPVVSEDPNYENAVRRVNHTTFIENTRADGTFDHFGVRYSDQNETCGRVGFEVSPYTYQTAVHNPRSYFWTEKVLSHITEYGNQYYNNNSLNSSEYWFGLNCSNSVDYVLGYNKALHFARNYLAGQGSSTSTLNTTEVIPEADFSNVRPLDIIVKKSHVWIIVELFKDASGTVRFVRCAESGGGTPAYSTNIYSTESLLDRKNYGTSIDDYKYQFTRLPSGPSQSTTEPLFDYVPNTLDEDFTPFTYNEDICTCKGDKVEFMWGDKVFMNVKRANCWEAVDLRKWDETNQTYETIKTYPILDTSKYPTKILSGDWVDVNMTYVFPVDGEQYGKFIAVATSKHKNILDRTQPWLVPSNPSIGLGVWLDATNSIAKVSKTDNSKTWAIPCKPNTTYKARQDITASENTLLRLAWGTMSNLNFVEEGTSASVYNITNKTDVGNNIETTVTTGANATYLFVQIGANNEKAATCREIIQVYEDVESHYESEPTYFEVLAAKLSCYWVNDMSHWDTSITYGTPMYMGCEANTGFTDSSVTDSARFKRLSWSSGQYFGWWGTSGAPSSTYYHATIRALGEYGMAKYSRVYITTENLYTDANKTLGKNISTAEATYGQLVDNSYRDIITLSVKPGQVYRYFYKRNLSSAYDNEKAAFYDANDNIVGEVIWLYRPSDDNIPATGTYPQWTVTVPENAVTLKFACLKDTLSSANTKITIYNTTPDYNYYNNDTILSNYDMRSDTSQYAYLYENSYREIVTVPCKPGETYRYSYHREASSSYAYERYAFLDEFGRPIDSTAFSFYDSSNIPPVGSDPYWDITVPANAVAFQIGGIKSNTNKAIYKQ